jgi:hypothetical protein
MEARPFSVFGASSYEKMVLDAICAHDVGLDQPVSEKQ